MAAAKPLPAASLGTRRQSPRSWRVNGGAIVALTLILTLFGLTFGFPQPARAAEVSPSLWPRCLLLLLFVTVLADSAVQNRAAAGNATDTGAPARLVGRGPARAATAFAGYCLGLQLVGFHVATPLFVAVAAPIFGLKRPAQVAGLALGGTVAIGVLFVGLLYLPLPRGELDLFYQLNARIDALLTALRP